MLSNIPPHKIHMSILSAALDHMVAISKRPGYQPTQEGLSAVEQLLSMAEARLGSMNSWAVAAFIRCAAGFKGVLQPTGLSAWQRELLQRPQLVEQLTEQGVANTLLALGKLTESDPQLARVLDVQLAGQLLQHAVRFARGPSSRATLLARHAANVLYGAALLGLQPDGAQMAALFSAVQRDLKGLAKQNVCQVLLASQKLMERGTVLRQEQKLAAVRLELDPYDVYYPGDQLMGLLLERACEPIEQQQLDLQAASKILEVCGFLGYLPSDLALKQLLTVLGTGEPTSEGTRPPKQPGNQADPRQYGWAYLPMAELKAKDTCEGVWNMLSNTPPQRIHGVILSAALDHMVAISKRQDYQQTQESVPAVKQLLSLAVGRLGSMNSWGMVAFIRCAAGFKGILQPAGLSAWQRELLLRPSLVEQLTQQGVANTLLSLGTLTESDTQLARVLDVQLARQLLQHAVRFALAPSDRADLLARHAANMLYGAALLGLQPDGAQVAALFSAVQHGISGLEEENVAQVVLASQKFIDRAEGLRQEHGLQAQHTELNPYYIYFPGNKLMGLLIKHACELIQQQRFYPREASQILGACGSLGYLPSDLALGQLLQVLGTGDLTSMDASATLLGCAKLGISPSAEVVAACWRTLMQGGGQINPRATANTAWALALLGACTPRLWDILTSRLVENLDSTAQVAIRQWHQAYLLMKLQYSQSLACPPELLERSLAAHQAGLARRLPATQFERALAEAVERLAPGQQVQLEFVVPEPDGQGWLRVDVALPGVKLAVEADGPMHFLRNVEPPQQDGSTKARDRLLRGWGWHVIVVPWYACERLQAQNASHEELVAGLGRYVTDHTEFMQS